MERPRPAATVGSQADEDEGTDKLREAGLAAAAAGATRGTTTAEVTAEGPATGDSDVAGARPSVTSLSATVIAS